MTPSTPKTLPAAQTLQCVIAWLEGGCDPKLAAKELRLLAAQPPAVAAIPEALTCSRSRRSDCALFDTSPRPSKEWYAQKIAETDGLDSALPCGALAPQPPAGQQDSYNRLEIDKLVYAITGSEQAEDAIADLKNAASCLDGRTIKQVLDLLEEQGGQQDRGEA